MTRQGNSNVAVRTTVAIAVLVAGAANTLPARQTPGDKTVWDAVYTEVQAKRGEEIYGQRCANCHGPDLAGADQAPSLTGPEFALSWNDLPLGVLFERIRGTMPQDEPGVLSRAQVADVSAFLLSKSGFPVGPSELPSEAPALDDIKFLAKKP
jgi:mono/diheme cytochrome c family protein